MKKTLSILLALVLVLSLGLTACGGGDSATEEGGVYNISLATGGTGGTYYGFCGVVAQCLNEKLADSLNITVESTGASKANVQLVEAGENQMAIVQNDVMYYAYSGTDMFEGSNPYTNFSAVMACYPETVQIIANKSITSIEQLAGKKVSVGDAGSGVEFNAKQILAVYGMDIESDIVKNNQSFNDSADSIKNGTIDAAFVVAGAPTSAVTELATSYDFNVLSIDAEHAEKLMSQYSYYTTTTIPAGTYTCFNEDATTVSVMATLIARNDVPEDVVYNFVKGMFDNKDQITAGHEKGNYIDAQTAVNGIGIPFHPGAIKYFVEAGTMAAQ